MSISQYITELTLWNKTHNLVSKKEITNLQEHIDDSLSLCSLIKDSGYSTIIDIGSGGGFPAIPLAFWIKEQKLPIKIIATDVVEKKITFLRWCAIKWDLEMEVWNMTQSPVWREEALIISRAFSSVKNILTWRNKYAPLVEDFLLLKGKTVHIEIQETHIIDYELITNPRGFILKFTSKSKKD